MPTILSRITDADGDVCLQRTKMMLQMVSKSPHSTSGTEFVAAKLHLLAMRHLPDERITDHNSPLLRLIEQVEKSIQPKQSSQLLAQEIQVIFLKKRLQVTPIRITVDVIENILCFN